MGIAPYISEAMNSASIIRKMFEEGIRLKKQFGEDAVFDFSLGNPDLEPPPQVLETIRELANRTEPDERGVHGYMPNAGYPRARCAMAAKVAREQGVSVPGASAIMAVGAAGGLNAVFKAILSPGDEAIVIAPYFAEYGHYVRNHGGVLKPVPAKEDFSLDIEAISQALTEKTAAVLINSPNNPSGKIYTSGEIKALADALKAHSQKSGANGVCRTPYLIADEPYREIVYDNKTVAPIFPVYESSIIVSSFAKNLSLPGERIGYVVINPAAPDNQDLVAAVTFTTRILGYVNAPAFFQRVVAKCWDAPADFSSYRKRRDDLCAILDTAGIGYNTPEGAFYLFCRVPARNAVPQTGDDIAFCEHLKKYNILGVPGTAFGLTGWFRLAYCVSEKTISGSEKAFRDAAESWGSRD
ncbi:MAG: pyridoxal phosphate-dependent aminotransferase [Spirochaetaceae bacterium]|jgi:aspartate aminotransferase|nr:pyridoxal phosphate-dependent aminotransferase [Spirochaetaceae bacterium]